MGIKERREREKSELREAILAAAREIAIAEGWANVSMRKIAERVEYSAPVIYEHFDDKEALLLALLADGFSELLVRLRTARAVESNPEAALVAMAAAYGQLALEMPELYQVMNGLDGVRFGDIRKLDKPQVLEEVFIEVTDALQTWARANQAEHIDFKAAFNIFWATAHGLVSLHMAGRMVEGGMSVAELIERTTRDLLFAWSHQS